MPIDRESVLDCLFKATQNLRYDDSLTLTRDTIEDVTLASLRVDSLDLLQLAFDVESEFGVEFDLASFPADGTFGALANSILRVER